MAIACVMSIGFVSAFAATADGTYTVPVKAWHATKDQASLADVIGPNATVTVADGQATMNVQVKSMEMMGIRGDLVGLQVSDGKGGFVTAQPNGTDANGNPTSFTFTVPVSVYDSGLITIKEKAKTTPNFAPMDDWQDARIKVDLASATQTATASTDATTGASTSSNPLTKIFSQLTSIFNK